MLHLLRPQCCAALRLRNFVFFGGGRRTRLVLVGAAIDGELIRALQPDWVFNPSRGASHCADAMVVYDGDVQRASEEVDIANGVPSGEALFARFRGTVKRLQPDSADQKSPEQRNYKRAWALFERHHYISRLLPRQCSNSVLLLRDDDSGQLVGFVAHSHYFGDNPADLSMGKLRQERRLVISPSHQGMGLGTELSSLVAESVCQIGVNGRNEPARGRYNSVTASAQLGAQRSKPGSGWMALPFNGKLSAGGAEGKKDRPRYIQFRHTWVGAPGSRFAAAIIGDAQLCRPPIPKAKPNAKPTAAAAALSAAADANDPTKARVASAAAAGAMAAPPAWAMAAAVAPRPPAPLAAAAAAAVVAPLAPAPRAPAPPAQAPLAPPLAPARPNPLQRLWAQASAGHTSSPPPMSPATAPQKAAPAARPSPVAAIPIASMCESDENQPPRPAPAKADGPSRRGRRGAALYKSLVALVAKDGSKEALQLWCDVHKMPLDQALHYLRNRAQLEKQKKKKAAVSAAMAAERKPSPKVEVEEEEDMELQCTPPPPPMPRAGFVWSQLCAPEEDAMETDVVELVG